MNTLEIDESYERQHYGRLLDRAMRFGAAREITHLVDLDGIKERLDILEPIRVFDTYLDGSDGSSFPYHRNIVLVDTNAIDRDRRYGESLENTIAHELVHYVQAREYGEDQLSYWRQRYSYHRRPHEKHAEQLAPSLASLVKVVN